MNIINKILTIPFFVGLCCMPLGVLMLLSLIEPVQAVFRAYGDWSFKQWEKKEQ